MSSGYEDLTNRFESGTVDPAGFTHWHHVVVAFHLLKRDEFLPAYLTYANGIRTLAEAAGVPDKFSVTITLAFLSVIAERIRMMPHADFDGFARANLDVMDSALIRKIYSASRLESAAARDVFLLPDFAA